MILSKYDIEKIKKIGFKKDFFVRKDNGFFKIKNKNGRCVFHNGKKCLIYDIRPEGCKLYPLVFSDEYDCAVVDNECPYGRFFNFNSKDIKKLYDLIELIKSEISEI